jgi:iron complex outermembrane recepter protein
MFSRIITTQRGAGCDLDRVSALRSLLVTSSALVAVAVLAASPGAAQTPPQPGGPAAANPPLPPIRVSGRRPKAPAHGKKSGTQTAAPPQPSQQAAAPPLQWLQGIPMTPLNAVAAGATRLGIPVLETPASVEVVTQQTMQDQGYRTTTEIAKGAVGVLDIDSAGAPANFSMRGFTFGAVNVLYNGISVGVASDTTRVMDTANLDQVEFLKGPSALMSGMNAIGGAVNYVSRQPTTGPIQNELDLSVDSLGTFRSHFGSGGSTGVQGLDYRFDAVGSSINSFIDGDYRDLTDLSTQFNYHVNNNLMTFVAIDYSKDSGHAYWGTPLVPVSSP